MTLNLSRHSSFNLFISRKSILDEISALKKQYKKDQCTKLELSEEKKEKQIAVVSNELINDYVEEQQKYSEKQKLQIPRNISDRFVPIWRKQNILSRKKGTYFYY